MEFHQGIQNRTTQTVAVINTFAVGLSVAGVDAAGLAAQGLALDQLAQQRDHALADYDRANNAERRGLLALQHLVLTLPKVAESELDDHVHEESALIDLLGPVYAIKPRTTEAPLSIKEVLQGGEDNLHVLVADDPAGRTARPIARWSGRSPASIPTSAAPSGSIRAATPSARSAPGRGSLHSGSMSSASPVLPRRKLPIGIQTFAKLRQGNCYYVDKTGLAIDLVESGSYIFLSRPRRFGKSLLVDTFKELFEGNRALFAGLAAEDRWDWSQRHPVIRISFSDGVAHSAAELLLRIRHNLRSNRAALGLPRPADIPPEDVAGDLSDLIEQAQIQAGTSVVVLVDEYDKPILDNLTDPPVATEMREGLRNLYSILKGADPYLRFVFLTGVSKFSKVSLFSGLNNLIDVTLDPQFSALCGYTDHDVDTVFAPELPGLDRDEIRRWYNGYNWRGESVYNPFDVLLLFRNRQFQPYWFETGTPTFLIRLLTERQVPTPTIGQTVATESLLSTFDVDTISTEALMFQAGYLTIASVWSIPGRMELTLKYPNQEVQASLNDSLLKSLVGDVAVPGAQISRLWRLLHAGDVAGLRELFHAFFASIPNDWYRNNPIARFEGYWASVFYSHFAALGLDIRVEDVTNQGRIDMTVLAGGAVWLFEFKVVELVPQGRALQQLQDKRYADKYRARGETIHLIGVEFSKLERNIVGFEVQTLPAGAAG